jgi:hypothetical protein
MSIPARQVSAAGLQPSRASALATRPVHMQPQAVPFRRLGDRPDLVLGIDRAQIGCLGQIDRRRLAAMELPGQDLGQFLRKPVGRDFAVLAGKRNQLQTAAEKAGGICFRSVDVRQLAAIDEPPGRAERGQREGIGRGSGGDREDPHRSLEQIGKALLQRRRPFVGAVAGRGADIGPGQRLDQFGRGAAGIVAAEIDHGLRFTGGRGGRRAADGRRRGGGRGTCVRHRPERADGRRVRAA